MVVVVVVVVVVFFIFVLFLSEDCTYTDDLFSVVYVPSVDGHLF